MRVALAFAILSCGIVLGACSPVWVPAVTRDDAVQLFPEAVSVRLRVHDGGYSDAGEPIFTNPDGVPLSPAQRARIDAAFIKRVVVTPARGQPPEGEFSEAAACFIPHHFFEYRDASGEVVGEVAVCFCCDGARVSPRPIPSGEDASLIEDVAALKVLVTDMGLPTDVECY